MAFIFRSKMIAIRIFVPIFKFSISTGGPRFVNICEEQNPRSWQPSNEHQNVSNWKVPPVTDND